MKMPKSENFNEILSPRVVVECPVFSGFTNPLIRFIRLIAFARIKDFYISFLCIDTIVSICPVCQNLKKFSVVRYLCDFLSLEKSMFLNSSVFKTMCNFLHFISAGGKWVGWQCHHFSVASSMYQ